jgi:adenosylhomocysteine nucleosidase
MMPPVGVIEPPVVAALAPPSVIAFVGLLFEARIAEGPGVTVLCRGTGGLLVSSLDSALAAGCRNIVSFGVAGGLAPRLRPGDWIIASAIVSGVKTYPTNLPLCRKLLEAVPGAQYAPIVGVDEPIAEPRLKAELYRRGLAAVDMESHLAAEIAARRGLALASIRVIVDPAHRRIPPAALAGLKLGGTTNAAAVLRALVRNPFELPLVAMLAFDALAARKALVRIRRLLGPGLGLL